MCVCVCVCEHACICKLVCIRERDSHLPNVLPNASRDECRAPVPAKVRLCLANKVPLGVIEVIT